ncbi:MAG: trypsin-like peptidase domain-containing protein [Gemmataceae bacterium]|nr:trypsin-like peptidase domain-containing protein [Gemmataceae bacterium]
MRFPSRFVAAWAALLFVVSAGVAQDKTPFSRRNPVTEAVRTTKDSIVTIKVPRPNGGKDMIGTGVIVDGGGIIVTNNHVVGACKSPKVQLADGTLLAGTVIFAEARWDLAAVRVTTKKTLRELPLCSSSDLMVGESVIAIGHPFGYSNTVSTGIISALNREINMNGDVLAGLIQIDAAINPGNSGGPLLNINGELIGINCALREEAQNIAFAISANTVNSVLKNVLGARRLAGVNHGLECREKIVAETGDRQRVVLASFQGDVKGDQLKAGDTIRAVGARPVVNAFDVERSLWHTKPGDTVELSVEREGKSLVVELTLGASTGAGSTARAATADTQPVAAMPMARIVGASQR